MSGKGKNFVHMTRDMFLLRVCFKEIVDRRMPLASLINVGTAVGEHSAYDVFWHNHIIRDEIEVWGGMSVNPMPRQSQRTGRYRSYGHMPSTDSRHRHYQGAGDDRIPAAGQLVPDDEEPIREV